MAEDNTLDTLARDIKARFDALGEQTSDARITKMIEDNFNLLAANPEFVRKIKFGKADPKLVGTKFARWGLRATDVEFLYDAMNAAKGSKTEAGIHPGPSEELTRTFKAISDAVYMSEEEVRKIDKQAIDNMFPRIPLYDFSERDRELVKRGAWEETSAYKRAMDTLTSGEGQQFVGANYVADLWQTSRQSSVIAPLVDQREMLAPTEYWPFDVDVPEMLYVAENTGSASSEYATVETGTQRAQIDAKKFVIHQMWSAEMEEDSITRWVAFLRAQADLSIGLYTDSLLLNGDVVTAATGNVNSDDAAPTSTKHYLAANGIRKAALVDGVSTSTDAAGAVTFAKLLAMRGQMYDPARLIHWGHPTVPSDLVYITEPATADKIAQLAEFITADKYGNNATVFNGQVTNIGRHPLLETVMLGLADVDGKINTGAGVAANTKGQVIAFNRRGVKLGWRRRVKLATEILPARDQTRFVYSLRMGIARYTGTGAVAGQKWATALYNI